MLIEIPRSSNHPQTMLVIRYQGGLSEMTFDDSHKVTEIIVPGVEDDDLTISVKFLKRDGTVDDEAPESILKLAQPKKLAPEGLIDYGLEGPKGVDGLKGPETAPEKP